MYIYLIFFVKICFIFLALYHLYLRTKGKTDSKTNKLVLFWKERIEFVFIALMSFLLIYLFNIRTNRLSMIDHETKLLLFLFGFILIITAKWDTFFEESEIFKDIQDAV
jgi:phosphoglycerol transferase MdoB-like AlkP superfamily enzyme